MKIFAASQIKDIDNLSIQKLEITSYELMERAASAFVSKIVSEFSTQTSFKIFCGLGNNGGDGFAISRMLLNLNYTVKVYTLEIGHERSFDNQRNIERLKNSNSIIYISKEEDFPLINEEDIIIDTLFGAGLNRALSGIFDSLVKYLNQTSNFKISVDIPTGLPGEGIVLYNSCFKANRTYTFQYPFLSFFFEENAEFIGSWEVLDIGIPHSVEQSLSTHYFSTELHHIKIKKRPQFGHKGTFGHALLLAGSKGMSGAAVLSARACLKSGCGLVTAHLPQTVASIMQVNFPEAICSIDSSADYLSEIHVLDKFNAIGIGPGIGQQPATQQMLEKLINDYSGPIIFDADALNILASHPDILKKTPARSILTPHPGEFRRLFGATSNSMERIETLKKQSSALNVIIVLKSHYTCIALPSGDLYFNTSGNSGMATAGSGDVLTGIILSLLAQGYSPEDAAITGVYLHGLAADCALETIEPESIIASDLINHISAAFRKIKMNT